MSHNQQLSIMINHFEANKSVFLTTFKSGYLCNKKHMTSEQFIKLFNDNLANSTVICRLV